MDVRSVHDLHVDCRKGLWLLLASLTDLGHVRAQITEHTNSAKLTGNFGQPDVTSYFTAFFVRGSILDASGHHWVEPEGSDDDSFPRTRMRK
jgi:hypothetical protein